MNRAIFILLLSLGNLTAQFGGGDVFYPQKTEEKSGFGEAGKIEEVVMDTAALAKELRDLLAEPHRYFRNGNHNKLIQGLISGEETDIQIAPEDFLLNQLILSQRRRNHIKSIMMHIILFAHQRTSQKESACQALQKAGKVAFKQIFDPELSLLIHKLEGDAQCPGSTEKITGMEFYLEHDWEIDKILRSNLAAMTDSQLPPVIEKIKKTIPLYPKSSLQKMAMKTIGDIHFRLKEYISMRSWYKKVLKLDPEMIKTSTIGYRMKISGKFYFRKFLTAAIYIIYALFSFLFLKRVIKNKKTFQLMFFLRRAAVLLVIYGACAAAVFVFDGSRYFEAGMALPDKYYSAQKPIVPLSALDNSNNPQGSLILCLGIFPILFSLIYTSFRVPFSKTIYISALLLLITAGWTHFILLTEYDDHLWTDAYFSKERIFMDGELEFILEKYPEKALKANPEFKPAVN